MEFYFSQKIIIQVVQTKAHNNIKKKKSAGYAGVAYSQVKSVAPVACLV